MSFSSDVKVELSQLNNLKNKQEVLMELLGYLSSKNSKLSSEKLRFSTGNEYNINRFSKLLSNINVVNFKINLTNKTYTIKDARKSEKDILSGFNIYQLLDEGGTISLEIGDTSVLQTDETKKAYVRGCFLGGGSITNPSNNYHLEMNFSNHIYANNVLNILDGFEIKSKILNNSDTLYIKDGEEISKFLAFIGASKCMLRFEEIRVVRDMKNNVNRLVNCETANMNKTIDASVEQISYIKKLKKAKKFELLSEDLKELANLREKNPNATLEELGNMLEKPIGKSSVSNRFKRIKQAANEII